MNPEEEKEVRRIIADFYNLKKKKHLSVYDEDKLIDDLTVLIGIFAINKSKQIESSIESMINFAKKNRWAIEGSIIEFKKAKQGLLKTK